MNVLTTSKNMLTRTIKAIYTRITEKPMYTLGRWAIHEDNHMWKKSDLNTEDHCGCDEMREQFLYKNKFDQIDQNVSKTSSNK